ncbi:hypothetical protein BGW36DRAFT_309012 [Talaromyces proteolyticus]|uniref:Rhodopsin domain-containing protein n=1 Tax=Talaromyces proteolyticus TaxID=1131652 RepID=A0AAD4KDD8_9EURO|nr:uncharacterized protein BGW36DRAFT_309012 [Talaromyces proteolyticus]KAH8689032.1 hypothetical protein BGW36DRAFT_309012 [Talaromyces proteolyticus]
MASLLNGPATPAPNGTESNLDNPPNGNYIAIPIISVCVVVTVLSYALRFYAKYLLKSINVADYLTIIAFPLYWAYIYYSYRLSWTPGYLVHEWDIRLKDMAAFSYICWIATILYLFIVALVKCAILSEWTNLFFPKGTRNWLTYIWWTSGALISSLSFILFVLDLVNCTPFSGNWDPLAQGRYCRFSVPAFSVASAATNLGLELIPLTIAQKVIWSMHLTWKKRLGVSVIFLISIVGCVSSTVRLYYSTRFYTSSDSSYYFSILALCTLCETTCANLVLCVPSVPKVVRGLMQSRVFKRLRSRFTRTNASNTTDNSKDTGLSSKLQPDWFMMGARGKPDKTTYTKDVYHEIV